MKTKSASERDTVSSPQTLSVPLITTKTMTSPSVSITSLLFLFSLNLPFLFAFSSSSSSFGSSNHTHLLQGVLKEIAAKQKWESKDIRVSKLDLKKARFGTAQSYEFRIGFGNTNFIAEFVDEVDSWKKFRKPRIDLESLLNKVSSMALLDTFKVEGPLEFRVRATDPLALVLPINTTHTGLNRIRVGEGITVEVQKAQEVSVVHMPSTVNSSLVSSKEKDVFWPFEPSSCIPLVPIHVLGAATLVAYRTRNPQAYIETNFISRDTIELLAEKCYDSHINKKQSNPVDSLSSRLSMLEKVLKSYLGQGLNGLVGPLRGKIKASALIRFHLELENDSGEIDTHQTKTGWRTRPSVERVWFEVFAKVEGEKLKELMVKKVRPLSIADTTNWSNLMSNISFTKFPSILVPPEALTLDIKW